MPRHRLSRLERVRRALPLVRRSAGTTLVLTISAVIATGGTASPAHVSIAPPTSPDVVAVAVRPDPVRRVAQAQERRLADQAKAYAAARRSNAEAVALAAVDAATSAVVLADGEAAAGLRAELEVSREVLVALTGPFVNDPTASDDSALAVMEDLLVAHELETAAQQVFALAFAAEATAGTALAVLPTVQPTGLLEVTEALEALTPLPDELVELEVPVLLEELTELESSSRPVRTTGSPWANGAFPLESLCAPELAPSELLDCEAADALDLLLEAYLADTGTLFGIVSSYRSYERQVEIKLLRGGLAATPGTSNHGLGIAIDVAGAGAVGQFDTPVYLWLTEHAHEFGWHHPPEMEPGGSGPMEPWHWEYWGDHAPDLGRR